MKMDQRPYRNWGAWLKRKRELKYRSAREFCAHFSLKISYPQYSRYESGDQLPSAAQLVALCSTLGVEPVAALLEWCQAQVDDADVWEKIGALIPLVGPLQRGEAVSFKAPEIPVEVAPPSSQEGFQEFKQVVDQSEQARARALEEAKQLTKAESALLGVTLVFGRIHRDLFESDPRYRDVFTYVNACPESGVTTDDLVRDLSLDLATSFRMAENLVRLGVLAVDRGSGRTVYKASKKFFYFPDDEEFFDLRNKNLRHNLESVLSAKSFSEFQSKRGMRNLLTREWTEAQYQKIVESAEHWLVEASQMDEDSSADTIYSVGVFMGPRFKKSKIRPSTA